MAHPGQSWGADNFKEKGVADLPSSELQEARKALFKKGKRQGYLTFQEISEAIPEIMMSPADRWLLFYSLRAMGIQLLDVDIEPMRPKPAPECHRGNEWDEAEKEEEESLCEDLEDRHPPL